MSNNKLRDRCAETTGSTFTAIVGASVQLSGGVITPYVSQAFKTAYKTIVGESVRGIPTFFNDGLKWQSGYTTFDHDNNSLTIDSISDSSAGGAAVTLDAGTYVADALTTVSGRLLTIVLDSDYAGRLPSFAGDGTSGVLVAHIGMEAGTTSTSPIKTDTAAVTRDIDTLELTDWDSIAPNDEGLIIFATTSPETLSSILDEELITSGTSEYIYRNSNDNGFSSSNGATTTNVNSGGDANVECIVAVIWSVELDTYCIGYYHSLGTFLWDLSPAQFGGFTPAPILAIIQALKATRTIRSLLVYEDWPPATGSLADVQTWVTLNAQTEITKHQIQ